MTVSLGALLKRHIRPEHQVLCVGPYLDPKSDPSALFASAIVGKASGRVHLLDSQSHSLLNDIFAAQMRGKSTLKAENILQKLAALPRSGSGDPRHYALVLNDLRKRGIKIKVPKVHYADAMQTPFGEKQFDVLIDAGSFNWILMGMRRRNERQEFKRLLSEYKRISKTIVLIGHVTPGMGRMPILQGGAKIFLRELGAKIIAEHHIRNEYALDLPESPLLGQLQERGGKKLLKHAHDYNGALVAEFPEERS